MVLTARNEAAGTQSCQLLNEQEGLHNVVFQELDVQDPSSIARFADWLKSHYGGLDILINNAGVSGTVMDQAAVAEHNITLGQVIAAVLQQTDADARRKVLVNDYEVGKACLDINYKGVKRTVEALLPLFKPSPAGAHIINVSSILGQLWLLPNESLRQQLNDVESLTQEFVDGTVRDYLHDFKEGKLEEREWPLDFSAYTMSKIALNAYTRILARQSQRRPDGQKLHVNVVHPGWVKTAMTQHSGQLTAQEAADALVWVALYNDNPPPSGQFFYQTKPFAFD